MEAVSRRGSGERWPAPRAGRRAKHPGRLKSRAGKSGRTSCGRHRGNQNVGHHGPGHFDGPKIILNGREMSRGAVGEFPRSPKNICGGPRADPTDPTRNSARARVSASGHPNEHPIGIRSVTRAAWEPTPGGAWIRARPRGAPARARLDTRAVARLAGGGERSAKVVSAHRLTAPVPRTRAVAGVRCAQCGRPWSGSTA